MASKKVSAKKRGPGRPRGSRTKQKDPATRAAGEVRRAPKVASSAAPVAGPIGSIEYHETQRAKLQQLFDELPANALPKDHAALDAGIARHSRIIAELRGEVKLTISKIVKSELFVPWFQGLLEAIRDEREAVEKIVAYLERTSG